MMCTTPFVALIVSSTSAPFTYCRCQISYGIYCITIISSQRKASVPSHGVKIICGWESSVPVLKVRFPILCFTYKMSHSKGVSGSDRPPKIETTGGGQCPRKGRSVGISKLTSNK